MLIDPKPPNDVEIIEVQLNVGDGELSGFTNKFLLNSFENFQKIFFSFHFQNDFSRKNSRKR